MEKDTKSLLPKKSLARVRGVRVWHGSTDFFLDDVSFSNSLTVEKSVFSRRAIGHVVRTRSTNPSTYAQTDAYFHFDQVGSVMAETDAAGALSQTHHQEAFGQTLASWSTGLVGGDRNGLHHNTKEFDGDVSLVYMYKRWYLPETGTFASKAPYSPDIEHPYQFAWASPTSYVDKDGRYSTKGCCPDKMPTVQQIHEQIGRMQDIPDKFRQCIRERAEKMQIDCRNDGLTCQDGTAYASTAVGSKWFPIDTMTLCTGNANNMGCGTNDLVQILIHEFAHACGMPDEDNWGGDTAPDPWGNSGIPGTTTRGSYQCTGR